MNHERIKRMVLFAALSAILIIMSFTPLGYLKIGLVEITFLTIPVVIAAILLGPVYGTLAGGLFGVTSLIQAISGTSAFGAAIFSISPVYTIILCLVPRLLIGFLSGILFNVLKKYDKARIWSSVVTTTFGAFVNTVFFTVFFVLFFRNANLSSINLDLSSMKFIDVVLVIITTNAIIEIIICGIVGAAVSKAIMHFLSEDK